MACLWLNKCSYSSSSSNIIGVALLLVFGRFGGALQASCNTSTVEWIIDPNNPEENLKTCCLEAEEVLDNNFSISTAIDRMTLGFDVDNKKGLRSLPSNLFLVFPDLKAVKVNNCSVISVNEENFRSLSKLKYLNLQRNEIENIASDALVDLVSLEFLYLAYNKITFVEKRIFASLKALRRLFLSFNEIKFLSPQISSSLVTVANLESWINEIQNVDDNIFESMTNLETFSMTHNKLETIPKNLFKNNLKLESVWFDNNRIKAIDENMFDHIPSLTYVDFDNNVCVNKFYYARNFDAMRNDLKQNCNRIQEALTNAVAATVIEIIKPVLENLEKQNLDFQKQLDQKSEEIRDLKANAEKVAKKQIGT